MDRIKFYRPSIGLIIAPFCRWEIIPVIGKTSGGTIFIDWLCFEVSIWLND